MYDRVRFYKKEWLPVGKETKRIKLEEDGEITGRLVYRETTQSTSHSGRSRVCKVDEQGGK